MARLAKLVLLAALASSVWAQRQMSVGALEQFIKSSIELKHKDKDIADIVKTLQESMESMGGK